MADKNNIADKQQKLIRDLHKSTLTEKAMMNLLDKYDDLEIWKTPIKDEGGLSIYQILLDGSLPNEIDENDKQDNTQSDNRQVWQSSHHGSPSYGDVTDQDLDDLIDSAAKRKPASKLGRIDTGVLVIKKFHESLDEKTFMDLVSRSCIGHTKNKFRYHAIINNVLPFIKGDCLKKSTALISLTRLKIQSITSWKNMYEDFFSQNAGIYASMLLEVKESFKDDPMGFQWMVKKKKEDIKMSGLGMGSGVYDRMTCISEIIFSLSSGHPLLFWIALEMEKKKLIQKDDVGFLANLLADGPLMNFVESANAKIRIMADYPDFIKKTIRGKSSKDAALTEMLGVVGLDIMPYKINGKEKNCNSLTENSFGNEHVFFLGDRCFMVKGTPSSVSMLQKCISEIKNIYQVNHEILVLEGLVSTAGKPGNTGSEADKTKGLSSKSRFI